MRPTVISYAATRTTLPVLDLAKIGEGGLSGATAERRAALRGRPISRGQPSLSATAGRIDGVSSGRRNSRREARTPVRGVPHLGRAGRRATAPSRVTALAFGRKGRGIAAAESGGGGLRVS